MSGPESSGVRLSWVHLFWTLPPKFFSPRFGGLGLQRLWRLVLVRPESVCPGYILFWTLPPKFFSPRFGSPGQCGRGSARMRLAASAESGGGRLGGLQRLRCRVQSQSRAVCSGYICSELSLQSSFLLVLGALASADVAPGPGLCGAVCPGYICSGLSLQNSFHTKWSAVQAYPIRFKAFPLVSGP